MDFADPAAGVDGDDSRRSRKIICSLGRVFEDGSFVDYRREGPLSAQGWRHFRGFRESRGRGGRRR